MPARSTSITRTPSKPPCGQASRPLRSWSLWLWLWAQQPPCKCSRCITGPTRSVPVSLTSPPPHGFPSPHGFLAAALWELKIRLSSGSPTLRPPRRLGYGGAAGLPGQAGGESSGAEDEAVNRCLYRQTAHTPRPVRVS